MTLYVMPTPEKKFPKNGVFLDFSSITGKPVIYADKNDPLRY